MENLCQPQSEGSMTKEDWRGAVLLPFKMEEGGVPRNVGGPQELEKVRKWIVL